MLKRYLLVPLFFIAMFSSNAFAGTCGGGKIIEIKEGGWSTGGWNGLFIKVDNSRFTSQHSASAYHHGFIHFSASSIPADRLDAIRKMALVAYTTKTDVFVYTHTGSCANATEMSLLD